MSRALLDRLSLTEARIQDMAAAVEAVAKSADPVTRIQAYRFVGAFRRISNSEDGTRKRYQRIETVFPIHRTPCLPIHR